MLAYRRIRRWSNGLRILNAEMLQLTQGRQPKPTPVQGINEIDFLLMSFNDMAGKLLGVQSALRASNENLEHQVTRRTKQYQSAAAEADAANKAKDQFLARMSHEIRTPLNGILGSIAILKGDPDSSTKARLLAAADVSSRTLLNLINDILDFSAVEAGQIELASCPFTFAAVIQDAHTVVGTLANQKHLELAFHIEGTAQQQFMGDPKRLGQIIINLVGNAIKFTDAGSITTTVSPDHTHPDLIRVSVTDTGVGIAEHDRKKIFDNYGQADNDRNRLRGGTGLGLAISQELVRLMGGEIAVESQVGVGSTFSFAIPLTRATHNMQAAAVNTTAHHDSPPLHSQDDSNAPAGDVRVLVVEDNSINQFIVQQMLLKIGITPDIAGSGSDAIKRTQHQRYDLIFMDLHLPDGDGVTFTQTIRQHEKNTPSLTRTPIYALTANALQSERTRCLDADMDGYLTKPIHTEALYDTIRKHRPQQAVASSDNITNAPPASAADANVTSTPAHLPSFALAELRELCSNDQDQLAQLLSVMHTRFCELKEQLSQITPATSSDKVADIAHSIAGCALQSGVHAASTIARELEAASMESRQNIIKKLLDTLDTCCNELSTYNSEPATPTAISP